MSIKVSKIADFTAQYVTANLTIVQHSSIPFPVKSVFGWIMIQQRVQPINVTNTSYPISWAQPWKNYRDGFNQSTKRINQPDIMSSDLPAISRKLDADLDRKIEIVHI